MKSNVRDYYFYPGFMRLRHTNAVQGDVIGMAGDIPYMFHSNGLDHAVIPQVVSNCKHCLYLLAQEQEHAIRQLDTRPKLVLSGV
jgi:hypothetical protein